jgi:hypothetical protein
LKVLGAPWGGKKRRVGMLDDLGCSADQAGAYPVEPAVTNACMRPAESWVLHTPRRAVLHSTRCRLPLVSPSLHRT